MLDEMYLTQAKFQKDHINLLKMLETASGGEYHWDCQMDVMSRRKKQKDEQPEGDDEEKCHFGRTNVNFLIFQQKSVFQNWWAQSEARFKRGLANRFLFSSGRRVTQQAGYDGVSEHIGKFITAFIREFVFACGETCPESKLAWRWAPHIKMELKRL